MNLFCCKCIFSLNHVSWKQGIWTAFSIKFTFCIVPLRICIKSIVKFINMKVRRVIDYCSINKFTWNWNIIFHSEFCQLQQQLLVLKLMFCIPPLVLNLKYYFLKAKPSLLVKYQSTTVSFCRKIVCGISTFQRLFSLSKNFEKEGLATLDFDLSVLLC